MLCTRVRISVVYSMVDLVHDVTVYNNPLTTRARDITIDITGLEQKESNVVFFGCGCRWVSLAAVVGSDWGFVRDQKNVE